MCEEIKFLKWKYLKFRIIDTVSFVPNLNSNHFAIPRNIHGDFQQTICLPVAENYLFPFNGFFILCF